MPSKVHIDKLFKICQNCQFKFFNLDGKGSFYWPRLRSKYFEKTEGKYSLMDYPVTFPARYFVFGEGEYIDADDCIRENGTRCKHKGLCNCSYLTLVRDKEIIVFRKNLFYKVLSKLIKKGHLSLEISQDCPYFMEMSLMKECAKKEFKHIILKGKDTER